MASFTKTKVLPVLVRDIEFPPSAVQPIIPELSATYQNILAASEILRSHTAPVAFPTETVYGLGASALHSTAVRQVFNVKNRPSDNPLIVHISSVEQLSRVLHTEIPEIYDPLIAQFWPGPLTIILPLPPLNADGTPVLSPACTPGQQTFGVRIPAHKVARALIAISDTPLAAPSANASTRPSPTSAAHVLHDLDGRIPIILDGGESNVGVESTVVDGTVTPPAILRPGGVSAEDIKRVGGELWKNVVVGKATAGKDEAVRTPGMKYRHYSPTAKVIVFLGSHDGSTIEADVDEYIKENDLIVANIAVLTAAEFNINKWSSSFQDRIKTVFKLGVSSEEVARNLFKGLREVDEHDVDLIIAEGISEHDQGAAVMNRLRKAASRVYQK
ncbi:DHBP synthase RibB-like alpha/beta domain-containing protein [Lipomyces japonicus]|uniref:DHBP synthase RibB-like alpha/beta domain-containing protein n=1 Tax=Lipomyces japonicus TaxID=56871 RepID=UPI0034CF535B